MSPKAIHQSSAPYKARDFDFTMANSGNVGKGLYLYTDGSGIAKAKSHGHKYSQEVNIGNLNIKVFNTQRDYDKEWMRYGSKDKYNAELIKQGYDTIRYSSAGHHNNLAVIDPNKVKAIISSEPRPIKP